MLVGQYGGRHHHCHLLAVCGGLECGSDCHFCLAKSHISAYQSIHRTLLLHVSLHVLGSLQLVGCVFIDKTCLQFMLHVAILAVGKTLLLQAGRIQFDEVACNVLHFGFHAFLHAFPCASTYSVQCGGLALFPLVFGNLVQGMNGHIDCIVVLIDNLDHLLHHIALRDSDKSSKTSHSMIDMHHIVIYVKLL